MELYGVVGVGGCGRVMMPIAMEMLYLEKQGKEFEAVFVVERGYGEPGMVDGHRVIFADEFLATDKKCFNVGISDSKERQRIAEKFIASGAVPFSIRAFNSIHFGKAEVGDGAYICALTNIETGTKIGKFLHLYTYASVAHDCRIGDYVTIAADVHLNGWTAVEDHVYIGTGAMIREGTPKKPITIGRGAIVGMGAVVTKDVPPAVTVVGNPARILEKNK